MSVDESLVGDRDLVDVELHEMARRGIHAGLAQLVRVHLAETLEARELQLALRVLVDHAHARRVVGDVDLLAADLDRVERRLRDVELARLHQRRHLPVEERDEQRADVAAVDVGVGEDDHLAVADLGEVEVGADARRRSRR